MLFFKTDRVALFVTDDTYKFNGENYFVVVDGGDGGFVSVVICFLEVTLKIMAQ